MKLYQNILSNYIKQYETIYETNRHIDLLIQQIHLMPSNAAKKRHPPLPISLSGGTWFWINFLYSAVVVAPERIDPKKMDLIGLEPSWEARHIDQMHFMYFILELLPFGNFRIYFDPIKYPGLAIAWSLFTISTGFGFDPT